MSTLDKNARFNPYGLVHVFTADIDGDLVAVALSFYGKSAEFLIPLFRKDDASEDFDRLRVTLKDIALRMCAPDPDPGSEPGHSYRDKARGEMTEHMEWFLQNFNQPEPPLVEDVDTDSGYKLRIQLLWFVFSEKLQFTMVQRDDGLPLMVPIQRTTETEAPEFSEQSLDEEARADPSMTLYFTSKLWVESVQLQPHLLTGQVHNLVRAYRGNVLPATRDGIKDSGTVFCVRDLRPRDITRQHHRTIAAEIHALRRVRHASRDNWTEEDYGPCVPMMQGYICHAMARGASMELANVLVGAVLEEILGPQSLATVLADQRTPRQLRRLHLCVMLETLRWLHRNMLVWGVAWMSRISRRQRRTH